MKFMMNGALTIGTRDGATIEMAEEAGEENFFLFGLTAEQVADSRGWYSPQWHYDNEPETRAALDLIFSDHFSRNEPGVFEPLRETLLTHGDHYMHLADLTSYLEADQRLVDALCRPGRLGAQGDPEHRRLGQVLERPHNRRICRRDLERAAVSGALGDGRHVSAFGIFTGVSRFRSLAACCVTAVTTWYRRSGAIGARIYRSPSRGGAKLVAGVAAGPDGIRQLPVSAAFDVCRQRAAI